ncbi:hypothetical protein [Oceanihabitans sediminis]|uniref:Tetratricopeptide repeat protein n=1 Tax=Oceanihabitans sediminis TaxID=1812012 RepID=A0A368P8U2_9FLAO|nr:hypothetical protein [Oceanihabitans sediminis]MDX1278649.1 hypothetical protein [Oceanihabitans sediminis]MDX1772877.1 hypothetical protein [Oceanihabitans sediminis]RBP34555.1 hypothetical protein DFR65_101449 [Oceanihabitans sediminis]RCU58219.1 hypothetical protein DU428_02230 [Oceanihabitans sediminis]
MKSIFVLIAAFFITIQSLDLNSLRIAYKEAVQDKTKTEALHASLEKINKEDKTEFIAYKGAVIALAAKHTKTLKSKKEGFIEGVTLLEYAIEKDPNNIEARFIRLGIQENTPKILKYKSNITEDKLFILEHFKNIQPSSLRNHIKDYILQSKAFTDEEKSLVLGS